MRKFLIVISLLLALTGSAAAQAGVNCPAVSIVGPAGIPQPGDHFVFTGEVKGNVPGGLSFHWEVSGGKIVEGQGTLKISVDAEWRLDGATITATLNVLGLPEGCARSASETGSVLACPLFPVLIDEFGRLANNAVRTRLSKFFAELSNNRVNQGYVILYGTERDMTARAQLIASSINVRSFDRDRITIVRGGTHENGKIYTKLYRVPPGSENPAP